jgi:hypothetical protein
MAASITYLIPEIDSNQKSQGADFKYLYKLRIFTFAIIKYEV